ncbi:xenobiotic compound family monooxygenase [Grosmannia clavigera kw1407]|uniref:Xenobiotic compound family monooxygenase n=1 Tax=Grosmannia clavigera (strain kw1407 / UAMH 11150) TaxID=655863 RepID=F0XB71_GROCL|nr:xenobiotic compound family monooxygenase [Grosmannia clavigera kw1407]EFX04967.1 xenobiotic compound family monooxygenase [Grosmannia clavigera kw1407]
MSAYRIGLWKHPRSRAAEYTDIEYWTDLVKILEAGKFHGLFLADVLGHYGVYKGPFNVDPGLSAAAQFPISDPMLPVSAMAAVTKHLSFWITASTTYENPFLLARRFATLDHLTKGRVAWNAVTSHLAPAAKNLSLDKEIAHDERYQIAEEFLTLTYKLWEGTWRDNAVVKDTKTKKYAVPGRVQAINHEGKYFKSAGPLTTEPSIQRTPFIFQAGTSSAGKAFATKHAECMFLPGMTPEAVKKVADDVRLRAAEQGRDPSTLQLIAGIIVIVDETDEKAQAKYKEYLSYADYEGSLALFGGWTGVDFSNWDDDEDFTFTGPGSIQSMISSWTATILGTDGVRWTKRRIAQELAISGAHSRIIGSPKTVADALERQPRRLEDIIHWLLPELRARGVFWDDYMATTTRENHFQDGLGPRLRDDHPGAQYKWKA